MPKPIKKRIKKSPIKEEELKGRFTRVLELIKERKRQFLTGLASGILAVIILLFALLYNSSLKRKAYALEVKAYNYYYGIDLEEEISEKQRWQKALELYKKSVDTKIAPTALFYLGNCYYNLGKYKEAISEYERFIKRFRDKEELLPLVYQKLASAYMNAGNEAMAIKTLDRLSALGNGIFRDTALILEARYYEQTGQKEMAMEKYRKLVESFPDSPWFNEANTKVEIEAKKGQEEKKQEERQETVK